MVPVPRRRSAVTINKINIGDTLKKVNKLLETDKSSSPQMRAMVELLATVIQLLLGKLGINSSNSSKPPSKDPTRKRGSKKKVKGEKRKPGGQEGHPGVTLLKEENPDKVEDLAIDRRTIPKGEYEREGFEVRQVIDIEITRCVTEYRAEVLLDKLGQRFVAEFPAGVIRPVQYGNSVKAQAVYMSQQQMVPYERVRDYFSDQCGIPLSVGSVFNFNKQAFAMLEIFENLVKQRLIKESLLHADETGINVNGRLQWLHTVSNTKWTLFFPHPKRGGEAMKAMGILEFYEGILCHDHWKPYFQFNCLHALCNAHHLRELERAAHDDDQKWAGRVQNLLLEMNTATKNADGCLGKNAANTFVGRYREILARGDRECPPPPPKKPDGKRGRIPRSKSRNLLERLRDFETEVLMFMTDPLVPFTNNQGENDIRMTKVQQKISGCFRSFDGARIFCRVRSYLSTCRKHGMAPTEALNTLFSGSLPKFIVELKN
jgi:transposase